MKEQIRALVEVVSSEPNLLLIRDLDGPRSITNDAEAVVRMLCESGVLGERRLRYIDTDGDESELLHNRLGQFKGFAP